MNTALDLKKWRAHYEQKLTPATRDAIDQAFEALRDVLKEHGVMQLANDDRAEECVAAITAYVVQSEDDAYGKKVEAFEEGP